VKLKDYIPQGRYYQNIADIKQIGAARELLKGVEAKRDEIRQQNETHPIVSDDVQKDFRFKAGMIYALNWVLELPDEARKYIDQLPDNEI